MLCCSCGRGRRRGRRLCPYYLLDETTRVEFVCSSFEDDFYVSRSCSTVTSSELPVTDLLSQRYARRSVSKWPCLERFRALLIPPAVSGLHPSASSISGSEPRRYESGCRMCISQPPTYRGFALAAKSPPNDRRRNPCLFELRQSPCIFICALTRCAHTDSHAIPRTLNFVSAWSWTSLVLLFLLHLFPYKLY